MNLAHSPTLSVPLTAAERGKVQRAAATAGRSLDASADSFLAALEQAVETVTARAVADRVQHDYAE
ncbi:hypothetical protein GCM10010372_82350 [Streptomyces tauricus]|uniref:hypothetical protein n=1 Tax=Streptomyces tauricus TaxID=68274 RepID=UPI0016754C6F|nr:hypothetical protein [Streptomyces tauricus]GHA70701.1 hypothetical protein GCM10010372_82350 [Streptomyces tauricus]